MLQLAMTAKESTPQAVGAVTRAVAGANARAGTTVAIATTPAPRGPVITVNGGLDDTTLRSWLDDVAQGLGGTGVTGTLRAAPSRWPTHTQFVNETEQRGTAFPTAMAGFRMSTYPPAHSPDRLKFMVDPHTTASLSARFVAWAEQLPGAQVYASTAATSTILNSPGLDDWLAAVAEHTVGYASFGYFVASQPHARQLTLTPYGQAVLWDAEAARPWPQAIADLRTWLIADAGALDHGHVRNAAIGMSDFSDLDHDQNTPGHSPTSTTGAVYLQNRHLWDRHVVDAAGLQVLTRNHLDRAHDLTDWTITPLTPDRYLVEANDLAAWFAEETPNPHVLEVARAAFGDMILNHQHITDSPGPYTRLP
jgi:hypothetical protein